MSISMNRVVDPGFVWYNPQGWTRAVDLREYPFPSTNLLRDTWDDRELLHVETGAADVFAMLLNKSADGEPIVFIPGHGVTTRNDGGARSAALKGAINSNHPVVWMEHVSGMHRSESAEVERGDFRPLAHYVATLLDKTDLPKEKRILAGHSKGARIVAALSALNRTPLAKAISLSGAPGAHDYLLPFTNIAIRTGLIENIMTMGVFGAQLRDQAEDETALHLAFIKDAQDSGDFEGLDVQEPSMKEMIRLIRGLGQTTLMPDLFKMRKAQPGTPVTIWHEKYNVGMPFEDTAAVVNAVNAAGGTPIELLTAFTRHNSAVAQSARFARQVHHVLQQFA